MCLLRRERKSSNTPSPEPVQSGVYAHGVDPAGQHTVQQLQPELFGEGVGLSSVPYLFTVGIITSLWPG